MCNSISSIEFSLELKEAVMLWAPFLTRHLCFLLFQKDVWHFLFSQLSYKKGLHKNLLFYVTLYTMFFVYPKGFDIRNISQSFPYHFKMNTEIPQGIKHYDIRKINPLNSYSIKSAHVITEQNILILLIGS